MVLTQPAGRAEALATRLRERGFDTVHWPLGAIRPVDGMDWAALATRFAASDWILFPSPGAIGTVLAAFDSAGIDWPAGPAVGLVGQGSRDALEPWRGRWPALAAARLLVPDGAVQDVDALIAHPWIVARPGARVTAIGRPQATPRGVDALRARGATVDVVPAYRFDPLEPPGDAAAWLDERAARDADLVFLVADAATGRRLGAFVDARRSAGWSRGRAVLTQHPAIARALRDDGWRRVIQHSAGSDDTVRALESLQDSQR